MYMICDHLDGMSRPDTHLFLCRILSLSLRWQTILVLPGSVHTSLGCRHPTHLPP